MFLLSNTLFNDGAPAAAPEAAPSVPTETAEVKESPAEPKTAARFAALAKKERELREMERSLKDKESSLSPAQDAAKRFEESKSKAKQNPLAFLQEAGLSWSGINEFIIGGGKEPEPVNPVDEKLTTYEKKIQELQSKLDSFLDNQVQEKYTKAEQTFMNDLTNEAKSYELIQAYGDLGISTVRDVMEQYYTEHKKVLPYSKACQLVENHFEEQASKLALTSKMKGKFSPVAPPVGEQKLEKKSSETVTLTNEQSSGTPPSEPKKKLTREEEIALMAKKYHEIKRKV